MSNPYDTQVGGNHYKDMKIQPSEFINENKLQFAEDNKNSPIKFVRLCSSREADDFIQNF